MSDTALKTTEAPAPGEPNTPRTAPTGTPRSGLARFSGWPVALGVVGILLFRRRGSGFLPPVAGLVLAAVALVVFVDQNGSGGNQPFLAPGAVMIGLLLVIGPWLWRLVRERDTEHAERIRERLQ